MKRIAVVCNYRLNASRIGGMDRFFVAYDRKCKAYGFDVKWFFSGGKRFSFYKDLDIEICRKTSVENCFLSFQRKEKTEFDFIITHFVELCTPFFKKVKKIGQPYVISVDHNPRPLNGFPLKKKLKNKLKGKLYSCYIDKFIGVSNYTKTQILNDYGKNLSSKTEVIYNGIAFGEYALRQQANHGQFIVASHLRSSKGIQDLVNAISILDAELKQLLEIDIFGEGPMEAELKALVKEKNLEEQIRFCGSSPELPKLFQKYSYLLQPTYMECFSLSILESLAANVPVITTPVGGNLEIIEDGTNGFIFEAGNTGQLSAIIKEILQHQRTIAGPVNHLIENKYYLEKMVNDHLYLLKL
ncbi:glycosyltransferase family 4 protein [Zunongwangia sp. F363]|uniref:Glycosyltransferase family 4 protein n=1 Tax=Autumnicola tepida TaxID=3075595 RepID=A0ABU3C9U4_9FLAO|nr:glycosyltransferase family 4 protein [Zunongwangia sp. F363]MDT0643033.1 glycosyltransferase family 4 protein [Zunongwangia sp. F363]